MGEIRGLAFTDTDGDGIFSGTDTPITNKTINLYLLSGANYLLFTGTTTSSTGAYAFSNLGNGNYKVDFNALKTPSQYFTIKGNTSDLTKNSTVEYIGVNS
ncbi:MAG: hypothetical protein LBU27_04235 [Candidatus Peribacteria bacterium]|nr:hypothetical protein [Candidatus Peribacteria bacterium]